MCPFSLPFLFLLFLLLGCANLTAPGVAGACCDVLVRVVCHRDAPAVAAAAAAASPSGAGTAVRRRAGGCPTAAAVHRANRLVRDCAGWGSKCGEKELTSKFCFQTKNETTQPTTFFQRYAEYDPSGLVFSTDGEIGGHEIRNLSKCRVPDVPRTNNGKKVEMACMNLLRGRPVANRGSIANAGVVDFYEALAPHLEKLLP